MTELQGQEVVGMHGMGLPAERSCRYLDLSQALVLAGLQALCQGPDSLQAGIGYATNTQSLSGGRLQLPLYVGQRQRGIPF